MSLGDFPTFRLALCLVLCFCTLQVCRVEASEPVASEPGDGETVSGETVSFELDVQPILTARGCNQGACHGKQRGQNGFQLSLLGFDSDFDFASLTRESRGRRVTWSMPEASLLLQKATGLIPHGGGQLLDPDSDDYQTLVRWISQGTPREREGEPSIARIVLEPSEVVLLPGETVDLEVTVFYSDGTQRSGTSRSAFQSNDTPIAKVESSGRLIAGEFPGETAVMVRYLQEIAACRVIVLRDAPVDEGVYESLSVASDIDRLIWEKLKTLRVVPSSEAAEHRLLRRWYVDLIGRLPTAEEARSYLESEDPNRDAVLVDRLLDSPEYAEHWANKWADLLRPNPYRVGIKAVLNYDQWIRKQFRENRPYDEWVHELLTAQGSTWDTSPVTFYRDRRSPDELTTMVSQLFLGIRLECAKCHHHPFERWAQKDFYGFAAFFADVRHKGTGLSPPISGGEEMVFDGTGGKVQHPRTQEVLEPTVLFPLDLQETQLVSVPVADGAESVADDSRTRRERLADWLTSPQNDYFAKTQANRIWSDLMGRGLVEPVDDLRVTNPATNEPLLAHLAELFVASGFDQKALIREIALSRAYRLSSQPNESNAGDARNFSRHYRRRIRAEVLLDSLPALTGKLPNWSGVPSGSLSKEIWTHRVSSTFLDTFGRPNPNQDPPCERMEELTMTQTLHLMNSPELLRELAADQSLAQQLATSEMSDSEAIDTIYLSTYARFPRPQEREIAQQYLSEQQSERRQALEDLIWALMNTPEFVFVD